jgi:hypothetical protein
MKEELRGEQRRFESRELLSLRQIASVFSGLAREQRQKTATVKEVFAKPSFVPEISNADEDNDYLEEPIFLTEDDEVVETLHENIEDIFEKDV